MTYPNQAPHDRSGPNDPSIPRVYDPSAATFNLTPSFAPTQAAPITDPDRAARLEALQARQREHLTATRTVAAAATGHSTRPTRPTKRNHPAQRARAMALVGSAAATVALAGSMALDDGIVLTDTVIGSASAANEVGLESLPTARALAPDAETAATAASTNGAGIDDVATLVTPAPSSVFTPDSAAVSSDAAVPTAVPEPTAPPEPLTAPPEPLTAPPEPPTAPESVPATQPAASTGYADGTFVGTAESTKWGDYQVQATISGGQLVSVDVIQAPNDRKSANITSRAVPTLLNQALSLQDANLDNVSGATWTSTTYKASLQSALDQALTQGSSA